MFAEFDEVNQAAEKLLKTFFSTSTTTTTIRPTSARDEKTANEYDYATNDEYDEDDEDDDEDSLSSSTISSSSTLRIDASNSDQIERGDSDWDTRSDPIIDLDPIDEQNQQAFITENDIRPFIPEKQRLIKNSLLSYLPYFIGFLFFIVLLIALFLFRWIKANRSYRNDYEKNYVFTEVDCSSPEERALHALQMNGYENPTYKFFENQTGKC